MFKFQSEETLNAQSQMKQKEDVLNVVSRSTMIFKLETVRDAQRDQEDAQSVAMMSAWHANLNSCLKMEYVDKQNAFRLSFHFKTELFAKTALRSSRIVVDVSK